VSVVAKSGSGGGGGGGCRRGRRKEKLSHSNLDSNEPFI